MRQFLTTSTLAFLTVVAPVQAFAQADSAGTTSQTVTHTVKRGDTLWDIAKAYLKNPFRWPEVFRSNTGIIKNPHWIYPGQVLTIPMSELRDDVAARVQQDQGVPVSRSTVFLPSAARAQSGRLPSLLPPPTYTVRQGEYEAAPYVVQAKHAVPAGRIVGTVDRQALTIETHTGFRVNDRLFVTPPPGVTAHVGDLFTAIREKDEITDIGIVLEPAGLLRVDSLAGNGVLLATVVKQFGTITPDNKIVTYERMTGLTSVRPVPGAYAASGKVLWVRNEPPVPSLQTYVIVSVPPSVTVVPGDEFTLYDQTESERAANIPPVATATVRIVRVSPLGATGLVITEVQPKIREGMTVHMTGKMP